jgi:hypothetical protein
MVQHKQSIVNAFNVHVSSAYHTCHLSYLMFIWLLAARLHTRSPSKKFSLEPENRAHVLLHLELIYICLTDISSST